MLLREGVQILFRRGSLWHGDISARVIERDVSLVKDSQCGFLNPGKEENVATTGANIYVVTWERPLMTK